ncbi:hypothetical protein K435DRAFT_799558 [Dendrothele bispora CBS 962.96]|uniref:RING-type domain-containing protein n=1 Tax=Dendrothele bispora (strain CBS 962.96) TaxID=1314807 RepID=A0A4V4HF65_DENBC|nr:hypothetical protein K435DRAFT_799558 [Dendrothele bispora CBS 962.96]
MSWATWYSSQYSTWNRTRRIQATPYLARTETNASRQARAMAQPSTDNIHGLGVVNNNNNTNGNNNGKDKKGPDSLFGPNVGVISSGPAWTAQTEKKVLKDELTVDVVKNWIEKSKEPSQPTTTLQALVNLKRPTIRLSPLTSSSNDDDPDSHHAQQHGLEFEYDCDAPKCGIYVHVLLPPSHPDAPASTAATATGTLGVTSATSGADVGVPPDSASPLSDNNMTSGTTAKPRLAKLLVFESVVEGGFGKVLKIEEGAVLELGRFDGAKAIAKTKPNLASSSSSNSNVIAEGVTSDSNSNIAMNGTTNSTVNSNSNTANNNSRHARRRLTHFFRRHNHHNMSVSGPALAVVDASSASPNDPSVTATNVNGNNDGKDKDKDKDKKAEDLNNGVRVTIRLAALDEQGTELASPNEQVTYLCIERFGVKAPKVTASDSTGQKEGEAGGNEAAEGTAGTGAGASKAEEKEEEEEEDTRPWVVKVVKREATIGPHTFHLHEIYGLTSSSTSSNTHAPTAPLPSQHTYPPLPDQGQAAGEDHESGDTPSECLLCLSSPREVVLLPCRHLVACKDCALNMVEFGAGGTITQGEGDTTTTGGAAAGNGVGGAGGTGVGGTGTGEAGTGTTTTVAPLQNVNARRKRKAKGWFCPVCRQPYTSLLRITTNPPPVATSATGAPGKSSNEQDREGEEHGDSDPDVDADVDGLDGEEADVTQADPIPSASRTAGENTNASESGGGLPLPVTTNVPGVGAAGQGAVSVNNSSSHDVNAVANATATTAATAAGDGNGAGEETSGASGSTGGGRFGRPGFLKGLTGRSKSSNGNGNEPRDLESQL